MGRMISRTWPLRQNRKPLRRIQLRAWPASAVSWRSGSGALAYPVLVDTHGYVFYLRGARSLGVSRVRALAMRSCSLSQLATPF